MLGSKGVPSLRFFANAKKKAFVSGTRIIKSVECVRSYEFQNTVGCHLHNTSHNQYRVFYKPHWVDRLSEFGRNIFTT